MKRIIYLLVGMVFLITASTKLFAQGDVVFWERIHNNKKKIGYPGYMLALDGDTIPGLFFEIVIKDWGGVMQSIIFARSNSDTLEYKLQELSGFGFQDEQGWQHLINPAKVPQIVIKGEKPEFLRQRISGKVTLFERCKILKRYTSRAPGEIGIGRYEYHFDFYLLRKGTVLELNVPYQMPNSDKSFRKTMTEYMADCPGLVKMIDNYDLDSLIYLVDQYNKCK